MTKKDLSLFYFQKIKVILRLEINTLILFLGCYTLLRVGFLIKNTEKNKNNLFITVK